MNSLKPLHIFFIIVGAFLLYSFNLYLTPIRLGSTLPDQEQSIAAEGKLVWQKYNCQSCHQIYNLGGYLGPDLTNCIAQEGKGEIYIKAMIQSGTSQMPAFKVSDSEMIALMAWFKAINKTGSSDLRTFTIHANGMIESNEKH